jgi:ribonuclease BN (tRNA processing enzyme)
MALVQWGRTGHMLVDAGDGVVTQLLKAGVDLAGVTNLALTHLHWDHILGYPAFVWGTWNSGRTMLTVTGPVGTTEMHERLVESYYRDQAEWAIDLGFPRAGFDDIHVRDVVSGWTETLDGCRIEAGPVHHPPVEALAFRFTHAGRSLVISGDTALSDSFVAFAKGADLMVADACASTPSPKLPPARQRLIERLREFHATPRECVEMATRAGVKRLVLTHHLPGAIPDIESASYPGEVIVGNDLDRFEI